MSRKSSRGAYKLPYINHMAKTEIMKEPETYFEFLEHIGPATLKKFPLMDQDRGTCTIFGTATALAIANRRWTEGDIPTQCNPRNIIGGNYTNKDATEGLAVKQNIRRYDNTTQKRFVKLPYGMVMKLNVSSNALRFSNFLKDHIVFCGGVGLGYPMLDSNFKSGGKLVPGFYGNGTDSHTICIIGCYNDKDLGPCFVTKTTNECWFSENKYGEYVNTKTKVKVGGKVMAKKYVSLAVFPALSVDKIQNNVGRASGIAEIYGIKPGPWPQNLEKPAAKKPKPRKKMKPESDENNRPRRSTRIRNPKKNGETEITNQVMLLKF